MWEKNENWGWSRYSSWKKSEASKRNATRIQSYHKFPCFSSISRRSVAYYCQQIEHVCTAFFHYEKASSNTQFSRICGSIEFLEKTFNTFLKCFRFHRLTYEQIFSVFWIFFFFFKSSTKKKRLKRGEVIKTVW